MSDLLSRLLHKPPITSTLSPEKIFKRIRQNEAARSEAMPTESDALRLLFEAYHRLLELGWKEIIYCPKDGSLFDAISAGSTGIGKCYYEGEWPNGRFWFVDAGDLWPASPILFKPKIKGETDAD